MEILLIRHGMTRGNLQKRYVGRTDEPVLPEVLDQLAGSEQMKMQPQVIYTSPLLRCRQTAEALFCRISSENAILPGKYEEYRHLIENSRNLQSAENLPRAEELLRMAEAGIQEMKGTLPEEIPQEMIVGDLIETDFGAFEYKTYEDLNGDPAYQAWIDSGGMTAFPGGESGADFRKRACSAFAWCLQDAKNRGFSRIAIVTHGGVIMAAMEHFARPAASFYSWQAGNGCGFLLREREDGYYEAEKISLV